MRWANQSFSSSANHVPGFAAPSSQHLFLNCAVSHGSDDEEHGLDRRGSVREINYNSVPATTEKNGGDAGRFAARVGAFRELVGSARLNVLLRLARWQSALDYQALTMLEKSPDSFDCLAGGGVRSEN